MSYNSVTGRSRRTRVCCLVSAEAAHAKEFSVWNPGVCFRTDPTFLESRQMPEPGLRAAAARAARAPAHLSRNVQLAYLFCLCEQLIQSSYAPQFPTGFSHITVMIEWAMGRPFYHAHKWCLVTADQRCGGVQGVCAAVQGRISVKIDEPQRPPFGFKLAPHTTQVS